jgi:hypothetical protein
MLGPFILKQLLFVANEKEREKSAVLRNRATAFTSE